MKYYTVTQMAIIKARLECTITCICTKHVIETDQTMYRGWLSVWDIRKSQLMFIAGWWSLGFPFHKNETSSQEGYKSY